jgi:hypothetical protein
VKERRERWRREHRDCTGAMMPNGTLEHTLTGERPHFYFRLMEKRKPNLY